MQTPEETLERGERLVPRPRLAAGADPAPPRLAARFASGYLIQLAADVKALDGPSGTDRDFTDLHAWAEVYVPGAGWIGLDPTSGLLAGEGHIPLACTADPGQRGAGDRLHRRRATSSSTFAMSVTRIHEDPRVTKPYTRRAVGGDRRARRAGRRAISPRSDVRLTQGGEPTFVSIDDMDGAGVELHRAVAEEARARRSAAAAAAGALRARRLAALRARASGIRASRCRAGRSASSGATTASRCGATTALARRHARAGHARRSAARSVRRARSRRALGLAAGYVHHRVRGRAEAARATRPRCRSTSIRCRPTSRKPGERARLARLLQRGLDAPAGFVLPLQAVDERAMRAASAWETSPWPLRRERLYLVAGDSPLGLRLPLGSLPDVLPEDVEHELAARSVRAARRAAASATRCERAPRPTRAATSRAK